MRLSEEDKDRLVHIKNRFNNPWITPIEPTLGFLASCILKAHAPSHEEYMDGHENPYVVREMQLREREKARAEAEQSSPSTDEE